MKLVRLHIENLLIIERSELTFDGGLSVISGETGAGKTVLTRVFDLLSGAPGGAGLVRSGASDAYVEATWELETEEQREWQSTVGDLIDIGEHVTTARRIVGRRSTGLINGRSCPLEMIRALAQGSLTLYGQYEQEQLTRPDQQRVLVDRGTKAESLYEQYAEIRRTMRAHDARVAELTAAASLAEREGALIRHERDELELLGNDVVAASELFEQLERLVAVREGVADVRAALDGMAAMREAGEESLRALLRLDMSDEVERALEAVREAEYRLSRAAGETIVDDQAEQDLNERLGRLHDLARKHRCQPTELSEVLERLDDRLGEINRLTVDLDAATVERDQLAAELLDVGTRLSTTRRKALDGWLERVHQQLPSVALDGMCLRIEWVPYAPDDASVADRAGAQGFESIRLMVRASPGLPWGPVESSASGGERSRLTLAFVGLDSGDGRQVVVMDEPDTGIGGSTAHGIGDRLADLAQRQQVIVVSHLPQIAVRARRQYVVDKTLEDEATVTVISEVSGQERVDELCRMSGYDLSDEAGRTAVLKLLNRYGFAVE